MFVVVISNGQFQDCSLFELENQIMYRGHQIHYDGTKWVYTNTGDPVKGNRRPCGYCNLEDTVEDTMAV